MFAGLGIWCSSVGSWVLFLFLGFVSIRVLVGMSNLCFSCVLAKYLSQALLLLLGPLGTLGSKILS